MFRPNLYRNRWLTRSLPTHAKQPRSRFWGLKSVGVLAGVSLSVYAIDEYYYLSLLQRSARAVYVLLWVAYQYGMNSKNYKKLDDLHELAAEKIFDMLAKNKGIYIKQGQAIANNASVFPMAYQRRFVNLYDAAPNDSWNDIDKILRRHLGNDYETEIFESFDHTPIASALIAQIHKARLKKEQQDVAVKIQHPYIIKQLDVDLAVYRGMSWVYAKLFDLPLSFFTQYVSDQLSQESDFRLESKNAAKLALLINSDPAVKSLNIYVPKNYDKYTRSQVLVTEWIDGVSLADKQKLLDANVNITTMMSQYVKIFARQIFHYGFVHSDPHPGNMLARIKDGKQQLVILDHGLYITLPAKFKREYCLIWKCLLEYNTAEMERIATSWGIGDPDFLTTLVQLKPPKKSLGNEYQSSYELLKSLLGDETKFPLQMLFLLRSMRMIQNLNAQMGSPVNRINLITDSAVDVLTKEEPLDVRHVSQWMLLLKVRVVLFINTVVFWVFRIRQILTGDRYGGKGEGIEDYIEKYMRRTAKEMGFEIADGL